MTSASLYQTLALLLLVCCFIPIGKAETSPSSTTTTTPQPPTPPEPQPTTTTILTTPPTTITPGLDTTLITDSTTVPSSCPEPCLSPKLCVPDPDGLTAATCQCATGFSGEACDFEDYCVTNPCESPNLCRNENTSRVCYCPGDFKGTTCEEEDVPVQCMDEEVLYYIDNQPSPPPSLICLRKSRTLEGDMCYDPVESLIYNVLSAPSNYEATDGEEFCINLIDPSVTPAKERECITIIAYEADDVQIRPWRNASSSVCFVFNRAPRFEKDVLQTTINLARSDGNPFIVTSPANDSDVHQELTYSIQNVQPPEFGDYFSNTGPDIALFIPEAAMDTIQSGDSVSITFQVKDGGIPELSAETTVHITLVKESLVCSVNEDPIIVHLDPLPEGTIGNITCEGREPSTLVMEKLTDDPFLVDSAGQLSLNVTTFQLAGEFTVTVLLRANTPVSLETNVTFTVRTGFFQPTCEGTRQATFLETDQVDTCSDAGTCANALGIETSCTGGSEIYRLQCSNTGDGITRIEVCAIRTTGVGVYTVNGEVSNVYGKDAISILVQVDNVNEPPSFGKNEDTILVNSSDTGVVMEYTITDPDLDIPNSAESFTAAVELLSPDADPVPFSAIVQPETSVVSVSVTGQLHPMQTYRFYVNVTDAGGLSAQLLLTVEVNEVNIAPSCSDNHVSVQIAAINSQGQFVTNISCEDDNSSQDLNRMIFTLKGDQSVLDYVAIDQQTGEVTIKQSLENSGVTSLVFFVVVTDGGGLSAEVQVTVTVQGDYSPVCDVNPVDHTISEDTSENVCFTVQPSCRDPVSSAQLTYTIIAGDGTHLFRVADEPGTDNKLQLCTKTSLKNQHSMWQLELLVTSEHGSTQLNVTVTISDVNDPPTFTPVQYSGSVTDNEPAGTTIVELTANDPDSGVFGELTFSSAEISAVDAFQLDSSTGVITTTSQLDADVLNEEYTFTVVAVDGNQLAATAMVVIEVIDVNDNGPVCEPVPSTVNHSLLSPVGTVLYKFSCSDADKTPAFNQLTYTITSQPVQIFRITEQGELILTSELLRNMSSYQIVVEVSDPALPDDDERASVLLEIIIKINTNIPPSCSPFPPKVNVRESSAINHCLTKEVICSDMTGGQISLTMQTGNGTKYVTVRKHTTGQSNQLGLSACVVTSLWRQFGTYQVVATVSNDLGTASITWIFEVQDVNERPEFNPAYYNYSIPETTSFPEQVLQVNVTDPDFYTEQFLLESVTAKLINTVGFDESSAKTMLFVENTREIYVVGAQNATKRDLFSYELTARDGQQVTATAKVDIHILDVNEAPICPEAVVQGQLSLLTNVDEVVTTLSCFDTDLYDRNTRLGYSITSGDEGSNFMTTENGQVILMKKLPRDHTGQQSLKVLVFDHGISPLNTSVTLNLKVETQIPAECDPAITPPAIWVFDACLDLTMYCDDPTTDTEDHLTYEVTGNYGTNFVVASIGNGVITMCYKDTKNGSYVVRVTVDNGLNTSTYEQTIDVLYERATPIFSEPKYEKEVSENLDIQSTIIQFSATTDKLIGTLVYSIQDENSDVGWSDYVFLNSTSGLLSSVASFKPLANKAISLRVQVEDTGSRLSSAVQAVISIRDENEAPSCRVTDTQLDVWVNAQVDAMIARFTCQDNDVLSAYRTLDYTITGELVSSFFKVVDVQEYGEIQIRAPLSVKKGSYSITLTVSDGGQPPLRFQQPFEVNVDLTPPKVNMDAVALAHDVILVSWIYARTDFYQVTQGYTVTVTTVGNVVTSPMLGQDERMWNATGLAPNTTYSVKVTADTDHGDVVSSPASVNTPEITVITNATVTIRKLDTAFEEILRDPNSHRYIITATEVQNKIDAVLEEKTMGYEGVHIISFRPGSVLVDMVVSVNQTGNISNTLDALEQVVSGGWVNGMSVDSSYFIATLGVGYVLVEDLSSTSQRTLQGDDVTMTCVVSVVGFTEDSEFMVWWTFDNVRIRPTSTSRFQITQTPVNFALSRLTSTLKIESTQARDDGEYACHAKESSRSESYKAIELTVIPLPVVTIDPRSQTVDMGSTVTIVCQILLPTNIQNNFILYKNGAQLELSSDETIEDSGEMIRLTVTNLRRNVVYGCAGENEAGIGTIVESTIGVLDRTGEECEAETDYRGTQWPLTAPGLVATQSCGTETSGEIQRTCSDEGWLSPIYNCIRDEIQVVKDELEKVKDGSGTKEVKESLETLINVTDPDDVVLSEGEIIAVSGILGIVADISEATSDADGTEADRFLEVASNLIDLVNDPPWQTRIAQDGTGAMIVVEAVDRYIKSVGQKTFQSSAEVLVERIAKDNLYVEIGRGKRQSYDFPNRDDTSLPVWVDQTYTGISVPGEALDDQSEVEYSSAFYRSLPPILTMQLERNGKIEDVKGKFDINGDIVSFQAVGLTGYISPPAVITIQHFNSNYSNPLCCYWDFGIGAWATDGCTLLSTSEEFTRCACSHFTNFAVLMSPGKTPPAHVMALSIISAVGCGISMLCIVILLIMFFIVWRYIKSDRHVLLVHLCIALLISYAIFLGGVNRTENKDVCTAISALLHYFYLVVFFLMLGFGIEIAVSVIYVFATKSRLRWILPIAWGIPAVIVGISLGVTKLEGYGNDSFCWLSLESGLLWAFVGPAGLVILINFIIVIIVFKRMFSSSAMLTKTDKEKAKTSLRSMGVLLPILGLTWVFGVFSVNKSMVIFQYIFAVCNSLQGLFILLFHGVLSSQVRDALRSKQQRKRSLATLESTYKTPSTGGTTNFMRSDDSNTPVNNDPPKPSGNNPFLEADRQVQELVKKGQKDNKLYDNAVRNNMLDKPATDVDLEDVKISNILRESEVMSGTSGISSILQGPSETPLTQDDGKQAKESASGYRTSTASSHTYDYPDSASTKPEPAQQPPAGYEKLLQPYEKKLSTYDKVDDSEPTRKAGPISIYERQGGGGPGQRGSAEIQGSKEKVSTKTSKSSTSKSSRSSRSDDDPEARMQERQNRLHNVYLPEAYKSSEEAKQARVSEAMPTKFNPKDSRKDSPKKAHAGKAKDMAAAKKQQIQQAKKKLPKDRSKAYQYPYDVAYLGPQSRHASLENVPMHYSGFNPYAGVPHYQHPPPGRQWDQYQWQPRW